MVSSQNLLWLAAVWFCAMNKLLNTAWDAECDQPSDKLVLVNLADHANNVSKAWPHLPTIARETSLGRRTIIQSLKRLEARGHVNVSRRQGCSNSYTVHPKAAAPTGAATAPVQEKPVQPPHSTSAATAPVPVQPRHQQPNHQGTSTKRLTDANDQPEGKQVISPLSVHRPDPTLNERKERELMSRLRTLLGDNEMRCAGGNWRVAWVRPYPALVESGLNDLDFQIKQGKEIHNRAGWLVDLLKRWKSKK